MKIRASLRALAILLGVSVMHALALTVIGFLKSPLPPQKNSRQIAVRLVDKPSNRDLKILPRSPSFVHRRMVSPATSTRMKVAQGIETGELGGDKTVASVPSNSSLVPVFSIVYPPRARRLGIEGKVVVRTRLLDNQQIIEMVESSGFEVLDNAVKDAVSTPEFKKNYLSDAMHPSVLLTVEFRLKQPSKANTQLDF